MRNFKGGLGEWWSGGVVKVKVTVVRGAFLGGRGV